MAKFVFRLSGVLRHRLHVERQRQRELSLLDAKMTARRAAFAELDREVRSTLDDLRQNRLVGRIDVAFLQAHRRYMIAMRKKAFDMAAEMASLQQEIDKARLALTKAATDRKALELLREKRRTEWAADRNRRETAELDEVGLKMNYLDAADEQMNAESAEEAEAVLAAEFAGTARISPEVETAS